MNLDKSTRITALTAIVLIAFLAFTVVLLVAFEDADLSPWNMPILSVAFAIYMGGVLLAVWHMAAQFTEQFYDLPRKDAQTLCSYLFFGLPEELPRRPLLRVQEGQANLDGSLVMYMDKVGGPGYYSIAHDNAVVTSTFGKLSRVLGPGFHKAAPFEKIWDVIDLRPQRRSLRVEFMTTDGIPAYCDAEIRFQVAGPTPVHSYLDEENIPAHPYPFDAQTILKLATSKFVKMREGSGRVQDWRIGLVQGALDGIMRDILERYSLDHFFNPRYWALQGDQTTQSASPSSDEPAPVALTDIEASIEAATKVVATQRGIVVDTVRLGPVMPAEETISRQWLEFWQAKVQRPVAIYNLKEEAKRIKLLEKTSVDAQVELVTSMLSKIHRLTKKGSEVPTQLIVMSFMDVLRTMSDRDPAVQLLMYQQAESLMRIVNAIHKDQPPFEMTAPQTTQTGAAQPATTAATQPALPAASTAAQPTPPAPSPDSE